VPFFRKPGWNSYIVSNSSVVSTSCVVSKNTGFQNLPGHNLEGSFKKLRGFRILVAKGNSEHPVCTGKNSIL
jgi:hypothetical protein